MTRLRFASPRLLGGLMVPMALALSPLPAVADSAPVCTTVASEPTLRVARAADKLARTGRLTIVALGSSSTAGVGASSPANNYPAKLQAELSKRFPAATISVVNRGVNGEDARENLGRMDTDVAPQQPDLVLWQVGTNALLRPFGAKEMPTYLRDGIARIRSYGAEVVLIDPQYVPWVVASPNAKAMVQTIADVGREQNVPVFRRYAVMQRWHDKDGVGFPQMTFFDGLHLNDWSYDCFARTLASSLAAGLKPASAMPAIASSGGAPAR